MPLAYFFLLLVFQLAGELIATATAIPVPGPVIGMALLFCALVLRGRVPAGLGTAAGAVLQHLGLLFVPAGVGVMTHAALIALHWRPIAAALLAGTALTIAAAGLGVRALAGWRDGGTGR
jgi:holin-like protein